MPLTKEFLKESGRLKSSQEGEGCYWIEPPLELNGGSQAFEQGRIVHANRFYDQEARYPLTVHLREIGFQWPLEAFEIKS